MRKNLASEDNICQAIFKFKKLLSNSLTSLVNSKSHYSKPIYFFVNTYKKNKKYYKKSSWYKHWPGDKQKR